MTPARGALLLVSGGALALAMMYRVFISALPLTAPMQAPVFVACLGGLAAFFFGLFVLVRPGLDRAASGPAWWQRPSALALVAGNLVPAAGVLYWGWEVFALLVLFWLESLVIAAYAVVKVVLLTAKYRTALKFAFFFGVFWMMYGVFVMAIFGREYVQVARLDLGMGALVAELGLGWPLLALVASHGVAFFVYAIRSRASADAEDMLFAPTARMGLLHVVIVVGGWFVETYGPPAGALLLLVALKTVVELIVHLAEHPDSKEKDVAALVMAVAEAPSKQAPEQVVTDANDRPLAHYMGAWRLAPGQRETPGWFAGAEFHSEAGKLKLRLTDQAGIGDAPDMLESVNVRGSAERIEFIEVRLKSGGTQRILRFTTSEADLHRIDLNEVHYPEGNPKAMQAKSYSLRKLGADR